MKRVSAIVVYRDGTDNDGFPFFQLLSLNVITKEGTLVPLVRYEEYEIEKDLPYKYYAFHRMYESVLQVLGNNGYYTKSWANFGRRWYDIQFINSAEPWSVERYSHSWH